MMLSLMNMQNGKVTITTIDNIDSKHKIIKHPILYQKGPLGHFTYIVDKLYIKLASSPRMHRNADK